MTLYLLTNAVTGMRYVGATRQSLARRLCDHRRNAFGRKRTYPLYAAMRVDGWNAFTVDVLANAASFDELMRMETDAIAQLGTMFPAGYNYTAGGLGTPKRPCSADTRARLAARKANYVPWNVGRKTGPLSPETRAKLSVAHKGQIPWNRGQRQTF